MNFSLFLLSDSNNLTSPVLLDILSAFIILAGIAVITSKNPIISVIYLIFLFANIGLYLILVGNTFIGYSYIIIYVSAVSILFLFILKFITLRVSELQNYTRNSILLGALMGLYLYKVLYSYAMVHGTAFPCRREDIYYVSSCTSGWDSSLTSINSIINAIGNVIYTMYNLYLILTMLILLLTLVGVIKIILRGDKNRGEFAQGKDSLVYI